MPKIWQIRWYVVFYLFCVLSLLILPSATILAQEPIPPITVDVEYQAKSGEANPVLVAGKDITTISITVTAEEDVCGESVRRVPIDVVLVIDVSGSMNSETPEGITKLTATQQAALAFLNQLQPDDQVALVTFSGSADIKSGLTRDIGLVRGAIQNLTLEGDTNIPAGINAAADILSGPGQNSAGGALPVIVVLSDGQNDPSAVQNAADRARSILDDVKIASIGLGADVEPATLTAIADPGLAFFTTSATQLVEFYEQLITLVQPRVNATDLTVQFDYDAENYALLPSTISDGGHLEGRTITWGLTHLNEGESETFSVEMQSVSAASISPGQVIIRYIPCEEPNYRQDPPQIVPELNTILPTATSLPTALPTATVTPTPMPTATPPPPGAFLPGPNNEIDAPGVTSAYCMTKTWRSTSQWIAALVLVLVLVIALTRTFYLLRKQKTTPKSLICNGLWSLVFIYGAVLLFFLLPPIIGRACQPPESVYFWRSDEQTVGIFLTHPNLDGDALAQATSLNETGCAGCHVVNNASNQVASIGGTAPGRIRVHEFNGDPVIGETIVANYLSFSPDGTRLAFSDRDGDIQVLDLTSGSPPIKLPGASDPALAEIMPAFNADGSTIAFVRSSIENLGSDALFINNQSDIYVIPAEGGTAEPLPGAVGNALHYYPSYSPNGEWITFTRSETGRTYDNPDADIYIMSAGGGAATPIEANSDRADAWASWSKNSQQLAFHTDRADDSFDVYITRVAEGGFTDAGQPLANASVNGIREYRPYWGEPLARVSIFDELQPLFAWFVPLLFFLLLAVVCALIPERPKDHPGDRGPDPNHTPTVTPVPANTIIVENRIPVLWKAQPTLVIGLGEAGQWVVTHLKKNLQDAALGEIASDIVLRVIDTAGAYSQAQQTYTFAGVSLSDEERLLWYDDLSEIMRSAKGDAAFEGWLDGERILQATEVGTDPKVGFRQRRVLARTALINNLRGNRRETRFSLWNALKEAGYQARTEDSNRLTVILVADISDDVGSGSYLDLAYLMQKLPQALNLSGVRVVAHLLTEQSQAARAQNHLNQVNTAAALRELGRLELAVKYPATMHYSKSETASHELNDVVRQRLFDELYLYDGGSPAGRLQQVAPQFGIFPAIADSITLWMDAASRSENVGGLLGMRASLIGQSQQQQQRNHKLMVSSTGVYQYRLPYASILNQMVTRFSREVLAYFLTAGNREPVLNIQNVRDPNFAPDSVPLEETLRRVLTGRLVEPVRLNQSWQKLLEALGENEQNKLQAALQDFKGKPDKYLPELQTWLRDTLLVILNGMSSENIQEPNYMELRGAKLALVVALLNLLCGSAQEPGLLHRFSRKIRSEGNYGEVATTLEQWAAYGQELREYFVRVAEWLGASLYAGSLYHQLRYAENAIAAAQQDMNEVVTRRTIWEDQQGKRLADTWYDQYIDDNDLYDALGMLYWEAEEDTIRLRLRRPTIMEDAEADDSQSDFVWFEVDAKADKIDEEAVEAFMDELLELARYIVVSNLDKDKENFANVLRDHMLRNATIEALALELYNNTHVALTINRNQFSHESVILAANVNIHEADQMGSIISQRLSNPNSLLRLQTSNPYALTLMRIMDIVPIDAVVGYETALNSYLRENGITGNLPEGAMQTAIYKSEAIAQRFERKLRTVHEAPRILHPVVVSFMERMTHLKVFLMALASGQELIASERDGAEFKAAEWRNKLLDPVTYKSSVTPVLDALTRFVEMMPAEIAAEILERYEDDEPYLSDWEQWLTQDYEQWQTNNQIELDLRAVARILLHELL